MTELPDEKIMYQVRDGQLPELRQLFDRYNMPVYNFFLKLTMDAGASEDLVQTLFYRILRYRNSFNASTGSFKSWMYQMARNLYADHCKEKLRLAAVMRSVDDFPEDVAEKHDGFKEHDFEKLKNALAKLGAVDREVIVLSRYEGLKYADIAKMKGMTLSAVKVQAHRALKELRKIYFEQ